MADLLDSLARLSGIEASIIETLPDPFFIKDRDRRFLMCNAATARFFGRPKDKIIGRCNADLVSGEALAHLERADLHVLTTGDVLSTEEFVPDDTGYLRSFSTTKSPLRDTSGAIIGVIGYAQDITHRKQQGEILRIALRAAGAASWDYRVGGDLFWSPEFRQLYGVPEGSQPNLDAWLDRIEPEDRERVLETFWSTVERRESDYYAEFRIAHPEKGTVWLAGRGTISYDADGKPVRVSGISYDITAKRQAEEVLHHAKQQAEQANLAKSKFLATASHDLRQPVQSALLFVDALKPHVVPMGQEPLTHLSRSLDALHDLLDSLLDISRLDARAVQPVIQDFAVSDLLQEIGDAYTPVAMAKGLELRIEPCAAVVRSDPTLLGRMVRNLVENALRYTEVGRIEVRCRPAGGCLRIEVHDTGIGIALEHFRWVWQEFHQVGNPERDRNRGLGLGLSIVQRLSVLLDHPVEMQSVPGQGSTFVVEVPVGDIAPSRAPLPDIPVGTAGNGRLALLVDDDAIVLLGLKATFEAWGYAALAAGSTDQALADLHKRGQRPDVVVADYRLREGQSGTEAVLRVRDLYGADVPGIILTGETGAEIRWEAAEHGLTIIHKPVTPRQLGDALARLDVAD